MRLVRYNRKIEKPVLARLGAVLDGDIVVDLKAAYGRYLMERGEPYWRELSALIMPANVIAFLGGGPAALDHVKATCDWSSNLFAKDPGAQGLNGEPLFTPYSECRLHAPVRSTKLITVRVPAGRPEQPSIGSKPIGTIVGPTRNIIPPSENAALAFAPGVAIVVGKACRSIGDDEAGKAVAGYTLMTDVTLADNSGHYGEFTLSMYETFAPSGPWLQLDQAGRWIDEQPVVGHLNGKNVEQYVFQDLGWSVRRTISYLSRMGLEPGDTIWLGRKAEDGRAARLGDVITTQVGRLGMLQNKLDTKQPPN